MGVFNFLYDMFVWITTHYSAMPDDFKRRFAESRCVNGRIFLNDLRQIVKDTIKDFDDYE